MLKTANYTAWELMYIDYASTSSILDGKRAITPVLYAMPDNVKLVVAESDLRDDPGMYLKKTSSGFKGDFVQYPDSAALGSWGFVSVVLVTFDNTIVLDAKVGEYILMAKQKNHNWYIGAMTNWVARDLTIDFSFLPEGQKYIADIYKDGDQANLWATHYIYEKRKINSNTKLNIPLTAGGGFVVSLKKR